MNNLNMHRVVKVEARKGNSDDNIYNWTSIRITTEDGHFFEVDMFGADNQPIDILLVKEFS